MSRHGNYKGNLSEKDELIKSLREKQKNVDSPELNQSIEDKINVLKNDKVIYK